MKKWSHIIFAFVIRFLIMILLFYIITIGVIGRCGGLLNPVIVILFYTISLVLIVGYPIWKAMDVYDQYNKESDLDSN
jgi:hypothetical protein